MVEIFSGRKEKVVGGLVGVRFGHCCVVGLQLLCTRLNCVKLVEWRRQHCVKKNCYVV